MLGILLVLFGYILGSVPTGYLVGRALGDRFRLRLRGNGFDRRLGRFVGRGFRGRLPWRCLARLRGGRAGAQHDRDENRRQRTVHASV